MNLWLGLLISVVLHAGLLCIPIQAHTAVQLPIDEWQLVLIPGVKT